MAWDLEGLIAGLLVLVSCAGEQGCSIKELLQAIHQTLSSSSDPDQQKRPKACATQDENKLNSRAAASIWTWLAQRDDVSIGPDRKYNHLRLDEILVYTETPTLTETAAEKNDDVVGVSQPNTQPDEIRIYASEETMWESITGHGLDYRRLPRSEWTLLLGIASTTAHGILQGDLGRLVDQDKRSVPKRTDALMKKGYISKRTTLVRGTKTSKMWLRRFAPPLIKDGERDEPKPDEMNLSGQFLKANTDPVPWNTRWTGESIDYTALATTIMAIVKAWGVMKLTDLKKRLGVLGLRWQMKVVSKTCRFLNSRGVIQYVAARLDDRVFKDCIKFVRELDSQDWNLYLATGKREGKSSRTLEAGATEPIDGNEENMPLHASPTLLASYSPWSIDEPLPGYIIKTVRSFGDAGLTNPDVYCMTLGSTFTRYLSSLTSALAMSISQPAGLKHLQLKSEHVRAGKVASYRYFVQPSASASALKDKSEVHVGVLNMKHGFWFAPSRSKTTNSTASLTDLCAAASWKRQGKGRPRIMRGEIPAQSRQEESHMPQAQEPLPHQSVETIAAPPSAGLVVLKLQSKALEGLVNQDKSGNPSGNSVVSNTKSTRSKRNLGITESFKSPSANDSSTSGLTGSLVFEPGYELSDANEVMMDDAPQPDNDALAAGQLLAEESAAAVVNDNTTSKRGRGRGCGAGGRGHGGGPGRGGKRVRGGASTGAAAKPYKCEKCGGSWKNDVGLKYHLEKAKTSCNPSWDPSQEPLRTPKRARRSVRDASQLTSTLIPVNSPDPAFDGQDDENNGPMGIVGTLPTDGLTKLDGANLQRRILFNGSRSQLSGAEGKFARKILRLRKVQRPKPESSTSFLPPRAGGGVLLQSERTRARQVSDILPCRITASAQPQIPDLEIGQQQPAPNMEGIKHLGDDTSGSNLEKLPLSKEEVKLDVEHQITPNVSEQPVLSMQDKISADAAPKKPISRAERNRRIGNLLSEILTERNGAFPGGEALWRALTGLWIRHFHAEPPPLTKDYQAALRFLVSKKAVAEHWHAFRSRTGLFTKCHLVTQPGVDAFSAPALELIDKIKTSHPRPYFPPPPGYAEEAVFRVDGDLLRQTRRPLPNKISTLSAPVYAAQLAAKRELEDAEIGVRPYKRRRRRQGESLDEGFDRFDSNRPKIQRRRRHTRWISDEFADPFGSFTNSEVRPDIQFLEPNTFMEAEPPGYSPEELNVASRVLSRLKRSKRGTLTWAREEENELIEGGILLHSAGLVPDWPIQEMTTGTWPRLDAHFFEEAASSFTLNGWMPSSQWFAWACINEEIDKKVDSRAARRRYLNPHEDIRYGRFFSRLQACVSVEHSWYKGFINTPPGSACPHNIFVNFLGISIPEATQLSRIHWATDEQLTLEKYKGDVVVSDTDYSLWSDIEPDAASAPLFMRRRRGGGKKQIHETLKRVPLVTRRLTAIQDPSSSVEVGARTIQLEAIENPQEVTAAIVAVRALLGGADKHIDWGLLVNLFPEIGLAGLRKFWVGLIKSRGPYISKYTSAFHEKFITAYEAEEIPMIDYDNVSEYDWHGLIQWAMEIPGHELVEVPPTKEELHDRFELFDYKRVVEDWREKFFHVQASTYGRFEAATSVPGAINLDAPSVARWEKPSLSEVDLARSWIKSLCCTGETRYTPLQIREQLLMLGHANDPGKVAALLKRAIDELSAQRIIHKSRRPALGGRPYRLTEWYTTCLFKLAQRTKFDEAASLKAELDASFRRGENFTIPYTLADGAMMALTNLTGNGRVTLVAVDVPYVPFGLEPGNYESRKFPKSYYHFSVEVAPTETYQYNEDIETLAIVSKEDPPGQGAKRELPQWIDFFGESDMQRWCDVLGSFCFAYSTRGQMTIEGICSALKPVLEEFEAHMIIEWGKRTGVLEDAPVGRGVTVGEWWWLAVPWQRG